MSTPPPAAGRPAREQHRVGQHTATIEDDTAFVDFVGDESPEEARQLGDLLAGYLAKSPRFYVICDVRRIGDVPSETRKAWVVWFKNQSPEAVVLIGAGIAIRMFVKLLIAATRVLLGQEPRFVLVGSEDEARAWVKSHRERARAG
ncbi:MAG TPA: STAS/SEC14 domain-containing protein [Polyangiaceae bacterium]|nr:STAS/SEC14 domain-containing protein [Polyangiaceae bacterium]